MLECIVALQARGYDVHDYPANPKNAEEEVIKAVYAWSWAESPQEEEGLPP